ncbi:transporter substrate-binding protein [Tropicimonas isoalkanivorans]|uniref:transporter substrate-binding protein n=1 Tax=Tropicimonas isoalkanivorans TaxID=441112 RepID=UPI0015A7139C|nr:transporter substrate-binding protein [Tropicimonas isoalkanivorans]
MTGVFQIGLIFSLSGPYTALGQASLDGALMAIDDVNAAGKLRLNAVHGDPKGVPSRYEDLVEEMVRNGPLRHIVGGITSWSRKDMIPALERKGALLWYPCPYEGFECNDHVVYLGACPNQHLLPLIDHVVTRGIRKAFLVGSNYVWGWETLRVAREQLVKRGVDVVGERHLPLGDTECDRLLADIAASGPDLIVDSLIGPSNHAFMQALAAERPTGGRPLIVSANQTEADLAALGPAAEGMMSIGAWFEAVSGEGFRARIAERYGPDYRASCNFATAYAAIQLLAEGFANAGCDDPQAVFSAVAGRSHETVLGEIEINSVSRHTSLVPRLAVAEGGRFRIIVDQDHAIAPDPYLTNVAPAPARRAPNLRIVS